MLLARHHEGQVFVQLAPPIEAPWEIDLCERLAERWEARGGSWLPDGLALKHAAQEARQWLAEHITEETEDESF